MTQTRHGWHIRDTTFTDEPYPRTNERRKNCKGPKSCYVCKRDIREHWNPEPKEKRNLPDGYVDHFAL